MKKREVFEIKDSPVLKKAIEIMTRDIRGEKDIRSIEVAIDYWEYTSLMLKERLEEIRNDSQT